MLIYHLGDEQYATWWPRGSSSETQFHPIDMNKTEWILYCATSHQTTIHVLHTGWLCTNTITKLRDLGGWQVRLSTSSHINEARGVGLQQRNGGKYRPNWKKVHGNKSYDNSNKTVLIIMKQSQWSKLYLYDITFGYVLTRCLVWFQF
jgi:hypothetical protein